MTQELDIDYLRQWIGREQTARDVVTPGLVDRFQAVLARPDETALPVGVAPRMIHYCLCQSAPSMAALGSDGHPAGGDFLPPVSFPRRMWAASEIRFSGELEIGSAIERRSRIHDVTAKEGKSGRLCFVEVDHEFSQGGEPRIQERQTIVYRDGTSTLPSKVVMAAQGGGGISLSVEATTPLLFRYSALTFNSHRIHYDERYAVDQEGYAGLVVHGPLQATLLFRLATIVHTAKLAPDLFDFRGVAPLIAPTQIVTHASPQVDDTIQLWTASGDGAVAMKAEARWRR